MSFLRFINFGGFKQKKTINGCHRLSVSFTSLQDQQEITCQETNTALLTHLSITERVCAHVRFLVFVTY